MPILFVAVTNKDSVCFDVTLLSLLDQHKETQAPEVPSKLILWSWRLDDVMRGRFECSEVVRMSPCERGLRNEPNRRGRKWTRAIMFKLVNGLRK